MTHCDVRFIVRNSSVELLLLIPYCDRKGREGTVYLHDMFRLILLHVHVFVLFLAEQPPVGQGLLIYEVFWITHNDAPQSVGLLWTSDHLVSETSTWQHTTLTTNIHARGGIRTHNLSRLVAADLRLIPRGHWVIYYYNNIVIIIIIIITVYIIISH